MQNGAQSGCDYKQNLRLQVYMSSVQINGVHFKLVPPAIYRSEWVHVEEHYLGERGRAKRSSITINGETRMANEYLR